MHIIIASSDHWYTNGTTIGITGVAIGAVGIVAAIVLWRFGAPRGLLEYSVLEPRALISRSPNIEVNQLKVTFNERVVQNPYVATLQVTNRGRRDIRSEDFDQRPLTFRFDADVVDLLQSSDPENKLFRLDEVSQILVCPSLISRGERISLDVLTDGIPTVSFHGRLADVNVRVMRYPEIRRSLKSELPFIGAGLLVALGYDALPRNAPHAVEQAFIGLLIMNLGALIFGRAYIRRDKYVRRAKKRIK